MVGEKFSHLSDIPPMKYKHLILRGEVKNSLLLKDLHFLRSWAHDLVELIGMELLVLPQAAYCDNVNRRRASLFAILTNSHLSLHISDDSDPAMIDFDLCSSAPFLIDDVLSKINVFSLGRYEYYLLNRDHFMSHTAKIGLYPESRTASI